VVPETRIVRTLTDTCILIWHVMNANTFAQHVRFEELPSGFDSGSRGVVVFLPPGSCSGKGTLTIRSLSDLIRLSSLLLQEWRYPDSDCYCWHLRICLENRSVSNLIEVMADERWERLVEQQGRCLC
jgi:hypothetical protein